MPFWSWPSALIVTANWIMLSITMEPWDSSSSKTVIVFPSVGASSPSTVWDSLHAHSAQDESRARIGSSFFISSPKNEYIVLLINIIDDPSNNTFTNEFLIEEKTKNILQILQEILHKIFYGKLFQKIDFIPFNY